MDTVEGDRHSPLSLHKYLYASSNPVNRTDHSGNQDVIEEVGTEEIDEELQASEADIEETAEKKVEEELRPETLVHVTSATNAANITSPDCRHCSTPRWQRHRAEYPVRSMRLGSARPFLTELKK